MVRPLRGQRATGASPLAAFAFFCSTLISVPSGAIAFDDAPSTGWDASQSDPSDDGIGYGTDREPIDEGARPDERLPPDGRQMGRVDSDRQAGLETLYQDAVEDLEAGERDSAQRLFERLIGEAPSSPLAAKARRHLADLYAGSREAGGRDVASSAPMRPAQRPTLSRLGAPVPAAALPAAAVPAAAAPGSDPAPTMGREARWLSPDVELQFIVEAGDRVFFGAGSADLGARARAVLSAQARWLKARPGLDVTVTGHADDPPMGRDQQAALAAARAEAVRQRLVSEGVDPARIAVEVFSRDRRVSECDEPECAAQNRRVVTVLEIGNSGPAGALSDRGREGTPVASGASAARPR